MTWEFFTYAFHYSTSYRLLQQGHKHYTDRTEENRSDLALSEMISRGSQIQYFLRNYSGLSKLD
jgi:hypothetical protein